MASERHNFELSGPLHLTHIDWKNPDYRRSVAASLVQGVYVLEHGRQQNRQDPEALAKPWWKFFNFELNSPLIDKDCSIFGAIFQLKFPFSGQTCQNYLDSGAPKTVIAFRGNVIKWESWYRDLKLDLDLLDGSLHRTSRFEIAMQAVQNVSSVTGDLNFWLAGHSLGAAIAMLAGKDMAKQGILLKTFLFNPPFISAPIERIKHQRLKDGIRIAVSLTTAGLAVATKNCRQKNLLEEDSFAALSYWLPCLFVNPADDICMEYVGYFQHRQKMKEIGAGKIERLATKNSIGGLFLSALGREYDPLHLIPSANLTVNFSPSPGFKRAHEIHQWWQPDLKLQCQQYHYK